jgi:hypothetical protein
MRDAKISPLSPPAMIPLFVQPFTPPVVLASSTSGDQNFYEVVIFAGHHPIKIKDERKRLVAASPVMTKSWRSSWRKQLPGKRPRETAEK